MANIVPSNDRTELACQLYFLRAILGNLYSDATELDKKSARIEKLESVSKYMRATLSYLYVIIENLYNQSYNPDARSRKRKRNVLISLPIVFSILAVIVISFALKNVVHLDWDVLIVLDLIIIFFGLGGSGWLMNKLSDKNPVSNFDECQNFDKYYSITIKFAKGEIEPKDVEDAEQYNKWLEKVSRYCDRYDRYTEHCDKFVKSHKDFINENKNNEKSIVNRWYVLERKTQIVLDTLQKEKDEYQIELNKFMEKKAYVASQFFGFLIEDDWRMIDDLIYMVVSGRATTMQEALNYGDLKLRHEETIKALNTVAQILNEQMIVQKQLLQATLNAVAGIYALSDKLDDLKTVIVASAASVNKTIKASSKAMCQSIGQVKQSIQ